MALSRARRFIRRVAEGAEDILESPAVQRSAGAARLLQPGTAASEAAARFRRYGADLQAAARVGLDVLNAPGDVTYAARAPIVYEAARSQGFTPTGGRLGANVEEQVAQEAARRGGAAGLAARAGLVGFREATDFTNYTPAIGFKGVAAVRFLKSAAFGAGLELGGEAGARGAEALGFGDTGQTLARLGGSLAGGTAAVAATSRVERSSRGFAGLRSTLADETGRSDAGTAALLGGGAAVGGGVGWVSGDTPTDRARNAMIGAGIGFGIGGGSARLMRFMTPEVREAVRREDIRVLMPDPARLASVEQEGRKVLYHGTNGPLRNNLPEPGMNVTDSLEDASDYAKTAVLLKGGGQARVYAFDVEDWGALEQITDGVYGPGSPLNAWRVKDGTKLRNLIDAPDAPRTDTINPSELGQASPQVALGVATTALGGYLGWESGESPKDRVMRAAMGALAGATLGASPALLRSRVAREMVSPHLNYGTQVRGVWENYHRVKEASRGFSADMGRVADDLVTEVRAGAELDPAYTQRLIDQAAFIAHGGPEAQRALGLRGRADVAAAQAAGYTGDIAGARRLSEQASRAAGRAAEAEQRARAVIGSTNLAHVRDRVEEALRERPEFFMLEDPTKVIWKAGQEGERARAALGEYYKLVEDQFIREQGDGAWDAAIKDMARKRDAIQKKVDDLDKRIGSHRSEVVTKAEAETNPLVRAAQQWDRFAAEQMDRARSIRSQNPEFRTDVTISREGRPDRTKSVVVPAIRRGDQALLDRIDKHLAAVKDDITSVMEESDALLGVARNRLDLTARAAGKLLTRASQGRSSAAQMAADIMERSAVRAERMRDKLLGDADRIASTRTRQGMQRAERWTQSQDILRQQVNDWERRMSRPVEFYLPHIYSSVQQTTHLDTTIGAVIPHVGGRRWFHHDRAYPTYLAALMDGQDIARHADGSLATVGDLIQQRFMSGEGLRAQYQIVRSMTDALIKQDDTVLPSFFVETLDDARKKGLVKLDKIHVIIPNKQAQQLYLDQMKEASRPYLDRLSRGQRSAAQAKINHGEVDFYVTRDWASFLDAEFTQVQRGIIGKGIFGTAEGLKELRVVGDFFFGISKALQGVMGAVALVDPLAGRNALTSSSVMLKGAGRGLKAAFSPTYANEWLQSPVAKQWQGYINLGRNERGALAEGLEQASGILESAAAKGAQALRDSSLPSGAKAPFVAALDRAFALERAQFDRLMPVMKLHAAEAIYQFGRRVRPEADENAMRMAVGRYVDLAYGGAGRWRWGLSQNRDQFERLFLFTNKYWRGRFETMLLDPASNLHLKNLDDPDVAGLFARRFWGGATLTFLIATMTATLGGLWAAGLLSLEKEPGKVSLKEFIDPREQDSPLNPDGQNFGTVLLPTGQRVNFLGDLRTAARLLLKPTDFGVTEATGQDAMAGGWDGVMRSAMMSFTQGAFESSLKYARDRVSIPVSIAIDAIQGHDYRGRPIRTADSKFEQTLQVLAYGSQQAIPGSLEPLLVDDRESPNAINYAPFRSGWAGVAEGAGTFAGAPVLPGPGDPKVHRETVRDFLRENKVAPTTDPIAALNRAIGERTFDTIGKTSALNQFRDEHPEVFRYLDEQKIKMQIRPAVRPETIRQYQAEVAFYRTKRDDELKRLDTEYRTGARVGNAIRTRRKDIYGTYIAQVDGAAERILGVADTRAAHDAIADRYDRNTDPRSKLESLENVYYAIQPVDDTRESMDVFLDQRRAFWDKLKAEDPDTYAVMRDKLVAGKPMVEKEYQLALDDMTEFQRISPYLHVKDPNEARQINRAINRARDAETYGLAPDVTYALLKDTTLPRHLRSKALLSLGGSFSNPARERFRRGHPRLGVFFSDLTADQLRSIVEQAQLPTTFAAAGG